ncbi:Hypothetical predicted protein [Pelobates cultripes]|uniref:Uncharacterized protein n=1 Tax=Pelobates cultripes TaxID=61616 RepID=A0AAD1S9W1_PELCU|nr:Hypothetical predicted protein [Pelobates cultripes]
MKKQRTRQVNPPTTKRETHQRGHGGLNYMQTPHPDGMLNPHTTKGELPPHDAIKAHTPTEENMVNSHASMHSTVKPNVMDIQLFNRQLSRDFTTRAMTLNGKPDIKNTLLDSQLQVV